MNRTEASSWRAVTAAVVALLTVVSGASAQDSSLHPGGTNGGGTNSTDPSGRAVAQARPRTVHEVSWTSSPPREVKVVEKHSIVSVLVDERTSVMSEGELDRKKKAHGGLILKDWVLLKGLAAVIPDPAHLGDPTILAEMDNKIKAEGSQETAESLVLKIACHVVDTRPNGNLVLEGHRQIRVNHEVWDVSLTGEIRPEDVLANNTVLSESVADLLIYKREQGAVRDAVRQGWLLRFLDKVQP
ncbi:MAG: flagellar basal body L-ring protein FlgH [Candidatus Nealsonbacteria bacterium]|nr:flagellar basal body L-ring protein FlgH [Candidatus Nealsonbacteria bacterium]